MDELEIRHFPGLELRAAADERRMLGYAAVFNSDSLDIGGWFVEQIAPGAFSRTLKENPDIRALVDHDTTKVIARTKAGTLTLWEDDKGLYSEIQPANVSYGNDVLELVKTGNVDGMSFGFRVKTDKWEMRNGKEFRTLIDVDLHEVSIVAFPAYPATTVSARSAAKVWEEHLKDSRAPKWKLESVKRKIALFEKDL